MSAPNDDAWFVLLTEGPPRAPLGAADVVGRAQTRLTRFDALRAFRTDCGLLPSPVPRIEAERIASALSASGVGALAMPGARLHLPAPAHTLAWAVPTDEGLRVRLGWHDDASTLPWTFFHAWRVARVLATGGTRDLARLQSRAAASRIPAPVSAPAPLVTREDLKAVGLFRRSAPSLPSGRCW